FVVMFPDDVAGVAVAGVEDAVVAGDVDLIVAEGGGGDRGGISEGDGAGFLVSAELFGPELVAADGVNTAEHVVPAAEVEAFAVGGGLGLVHPPYRNGPLHFAGDGVQAVDDFVGGGDGDDALRDGGASEDGRFRLVFPFLFPGG